MNGTYVYESIIFILIYFIDSIGIKLLCGRIRGICLGEITSRPETEYGTKQCMQSRHRMSETYQCRRSVLTGIAPPDIQRDACARMEKTKQKTNETLYMDSTLQREG